MMMGLPPPLVGDEGEDPTDLFNYLDLDADDDIQRNDGAVIDPDMEDLREEHRPRLKGRWSGWTSVAFACQGGGRDMLRRVYDLAVEMMPWVRAMDVGDAMMNA
jgi:hypothetical protein